MYCEKAGRECGYLEQIKRLGEDALIAKASADPKSAKEAELIEKQTNKYFEDDLNCEEDFCVALADTVRNSLAETALREMNQ